MPDKFARGETVLIEAKVDAPVRFGTSEGELCRVVIGYGVKSWTFTLPMEHLTKIERLVHRSDTALPLERQLMLTLGKLADEELSEVIGFAEARAAYRNMNYDERRCNFCDNLYRGPAVYCRLRCALADA